MSYNKEPLKKNTNDDRVLVLKPIEGKKTLTSTGLTDPRLFTGENRLHAIKDPQTCLWYLKYESGSIPPDLRQHFTGFNILKKQVSDYFQKRNILLTEVID